MDLGISRGTNPKYLAAYGLQPHDIAARFEQNLAILRQAWTSPHIEIDGERYQVEPKPHQSPHPPVYMATYTAETAAWAARSGLRLICHGINSRENLRPVVNAFRDAGGDTGQMPLGRFVYVSETDESARREILPTIRHLTDRMRAAGLFRRPNIITEEELEPERYLDEMVIAGSPATCAQRIADLYAEFGTRYLNALSAFFGHLPLPLLRRSLELLATDVRSRLSAAPIR